MDWQMTAWIIFAGLSCGHIMYGYGRRTGIENTLDYLRQRGEIDFDD